MEARTTGPIIKDEEAQRLVIKANRAFPRPAGADYPVALQRDARIALTNQLLGLQHPINSYTELRSWERQELDLALDSSTIVAALQRAYFEYINAHRDEYAKANRRGALQSNATTQSDSLCEVELWGSLGGNSAESD